MSEMPKLDKSFPENLGINELLLQVKLDGTLFLPKIAYDSHGTPLSAGMMMGAAMYILAQAIADLQNSYASAGQADRLHEFQRGYIAAASGDYLEDAGSIVKRRDGDAHKETHGE